MRQKIVDVMCRGVSPDDVARAQACAAGEGNIVAALIEAGFHRKLVLAACTEVTGLPTAPSAWFKEPQELDLSGIDLDYCTQVFCVPIAVQEDRLCVAYADPAMAVQSKTLELPRHRAYLATPTKVARALKRLLKGAQRDQTNPGDVGSRSGESSAFSGKARKRKRNAARAASVDGPGEAAPDQTPEPPRAAPPPKPSRQDEWEETLRLPASDAQNVVQDAMKQAVSRPANAAPGRLQVSSHASASAAVPAARGYEPLDPVMPAPNAPAPAPRPPRQRAEARAEAPPVKKRAARAKAPTAPSPTSGRNALLLGSLLVLGVGGVLLTQRAVKRDTAREAPVVVDGQVAIEARQRPLLEKANGEPNNASAVNQLTAVINLDPATATARDALIARARRYLAAGEVERARRDLLRVQRRRDAEAVKLELDKLQAEIGRANMVPSDVRPAPTMPAPTMPSPLMPSGASDAGVR